MNVLIFEITHLQDRQTGQYRHIEIEQAVNSVQDISIYPIFSNSQPLVATNCDVVIAHNTDVARDWSLLPKQLANNALTKVLILHTVDWNNRDATMKKHSGLTIIECGSDKVISCISQFLQDNVLNVAGEFNVTAFLGNPKAVLAKEFMISFGPLDLKLTTLAKVIPGKKEECLKKFHASNPGYLRNYEAFMAKATALFDTDAVGKERFSQLCGEKVCDFFMSLDRKVGHSEIELFGWTEISSEIDTFHKWYCEVAKLLKGSAVCEDS